jgi:hypothetical protein
LNILSKGHSFAMVGVGTTGAAATGACDQGAGATGV